MESAIPIRRFNSRGIMAFEEFLAHGRQSPTRFPKALIESGGHTELLDPEVRLDAVTFHSRFEVGQYFHGKFPEDRFPAIESNRGLWAWLAFVLFDQTCAKDPKTGQQVIREDEYWIPGSNYYRHRLLMPFMVYRAFSDDPDQIRFLLSNEPCEHGDFAETFLSAPYLLTNPGLVKLVGDMYYDRSSGTIKHGVTNRKKPGTIRRLAAVLKQFDRTWDLHTVPFEQAWAMLPKEFDRFKD